jgi:hypothetical protein
MVPLGGVGALMAGSTLGGQITPFVLFNLSLKVLSVVLRTESEHALGSPWGALSAARMADTMSKMARMIFAITFTKG